MTKKVVLVEHAKKLVERQLGYPDAVRGGEHDYRCNLCPKRGFANRSHLHINWQTERALCHRCGARAKTLEGIIRLVLGVSEVPESAYRVVSSENFCGDIQDILYRDAEPEAQKKAPCELPESFGVLTRQPGDRAGKTVLNYLLKRVGSFKKLKAAGAGYCSDGKMRGYAVFPIYHDGVLKTWTSRRVTGLGPKQYHAKNSLSREVLFNYEACRQSRRVFVTEGPFDALAMHGLLREDDGGVASLGTVLHQEQATLLAELPCTEVVMLYDNDAIGKAHKAADVLRKVCDKVVSVVELPDARDPDEIPTDELKQLVRARHKCSEMASVLKKLAI